MSEMPSGSSCLRLLILAPFAPRLDAPHGGGRVLAQFLLEISQIHQVALLYMQASDEPPIDPVLLERLELAEKRTRSWAGPSVSQKTMRYLRLAAALLSRKPMWVADWESQAFADLIRMVSRSWQPDLVQIEFNVMAQYLPALHACPAPRVLVVHEPARLAAPFLKSGPKFIRLIAHHFDRSAWGKYEPAVIRQVDAVVVFTPKDRETITGYGLPTPISLIPFGTKLSSHPSIPSGSEQPSLLFIGNYVHPPNSEAAVQLVREIYPFVRRKYPKLACVIVGPNPPQELRQQPIDGVTITGWVPDIAPYFERASLFVAPLYTGGGMRVKILEAMAAGKAIVTTPLAIEGLKIKNGEQILLAEHNAEMIERVEWLLANPAERVALATRARNWAFANLGWDKPIQEYKRLYHSLLNKK